MSVTYGFYNSKSGDRRYDAIQMSSIFDGIIEDGILQHVGTAMIVKESEGMVVNVGIGRAWFNHTWTLNDAILPLTVPESEVLLNRYDAVVLEVDARENVRANTIKIVKGTPATIPAQPTMIKTNDQWQYPLAYIYVGAGVTSIYQSNITNCVGTTACPFVTAPLEKMSIDDLIAQWGAQWKEFYERETADMESTNASWKEQWGTWFDSNTSTWKNQWNQWFKEYTDSNKADFDDWFARLQVILDGDVAGSLANRIISLEDLTENANRILEVTLPASGWSDTLPYMQRVEIAGIKASDTPEIRLCTPKDLDAATVKLRQKMTGMITDGETEDGYAVFYCGVKKPTDDFVILLKGVSANG